MFLKRWGEGLGQWEENKQVSDLVVVVSSGDRKEVSIIKGRPVNQAEEGVWSGKVEANEMQPFKEDYMWG